MKKTKKILTIFIFALLCIFPVLTGCEFVLTGTDKSLSAPVIELDKNGQCITWKPVTYATDYDIYCDNVLIKNIEQVEENTNILDLNNLSLDTGTYTFYVIASTDSLYIKDSEKSNVVSYNYTKKEIIVPETPEQEVANYNITYSVSEGGYLTYIPIEDLDAEYVVYLYSNSSGLKKHTLSTTTVNLESNVYTFFDEIYAVRMGYIVDDVEYLTNDLKYYNSDTHSGYTNQIYLFDGYINDYYIEDFQELKNFCYYMFINRITDVNIKISDSFKTFVSNNYSGTSIAGKMDYAIHDGLSRFAETYAYKANQSSGGYARQLTNANEFNIKISYYNVTECNLSVMPSVSALYDQGEADAYYNLVDYETLPEDYEFVSDKQFLYTNCTTSEQLYWAVENKVTPKFTSTTSRAYKIYNYAKDALRECVSLEMTEYEMALSIFDWISVNTVYDYTEYTTSNGYSMTIQGNPMHVPAFYLEGVFINGVAVCDGFSKAYSLMCNMMGIDCIRIVGDAKMGDSLGGHAWNKVQIDLDETDTVKGNYYLVDITWTEIVSQGSEELSHLYFGLSDSDTAETHIQHAGRNEKFNRYATGENLKYYLYHKFEYDGKNNDLVIKNTNELTDLFYYMIDNGRVNMEFMIDYDYMIAEYEKEYGENSYPSANPNIDPTYYDEAQQFMATSYDPATDTYYYYEYTPKYDAFGFPVTDSLGQIVYEITTTPLYYYQLRVVFQTNVMKPAKFAEQYFLITDGNGIYEYDEGKNALLFILDQNLLIDADGEIEHLVNYFDLNDITGTYDLYVEGIIINALDEKETVTLTVENAFNEAIGDKTLKIEFELISDDVTISSTSKSAVFKITVIQL